jgi:hypothetical protein
MSGYKYRDFSDAGAVFGGKRSITRALCREARSRRSRLLVGARIG